MGEFRVVTNGGKYWLQYFDNGMFTHVNSPVGSTKEELMDKWTNFNQALNKPILHYASAEVVEPPLVGKNVSVVK